MLLLLNSKSSVKNYIHQPNGLNLLLSRGMLKGTCELLSNNNSIKHILKPNPTWIANDEVKVKSVLTTIANCLDVIKEKKGSLVQELCDLQTKEKTEFCIQARIFSGLSKDPVILKNMYYDMIDRDCIIDNLIFSPNALEEYVSINKFYELKLASDFAKQNKCKITIFGENEIIPLKYSLDARQQHCDGFLQFGGVSRGFDLKVGTIKDETHSTISPIFLNNNKNMQISNNLDIIEFFNEKINTFSSIMKKLPEEKLLNLMFQEIQMLLKSKDAPLAKKFEGINTFNTMLILNEKIRYSGGFIHVYDHFQNSKDIDIEMIKRFLYLRSISGNPDTLTYLQFCMSDFIKTYASQELIDLLIKTKKRRHPKIIEMLDNSDIWKWK